MKNMFYREFEVQPEGTRIELERAVAHLQFNSDGLIPVIAQQFDTKEVLMMAWMNKESLLKSLETGDMWYWSRSRQAYWRKGESSGHVQKLKRMRIDCDGDTILCYVDQLGPACHTNRRSCFYALADLEQQELVIQQES